MSIYKKYLKDLDKWMKLEPECPKLIIVRNDSSKVKVFITQEGQGSIVADGSFHIEDFESLKTRFEKSIQDKEEEMWFVTPELCVELFVLSNTEVECIIEWLSKVTSEE